MTEQFKRIEITVDDETFHGVVRCSDSQVAVCGSQVVVETAIELLEGGRMSAGELVWHSLWEVTEGDHD